MISERVLKKYRREALLYIQENQTGYMDYRDACKRILVLTQELLDRQLIEKRRINHGRSNVDRTI